MIMITHVLFAVLVCLVFNVPLDFGVFLGSTLPDIDYPHSRIGEMFFPLSDWINKKFGHRSLFHSIYWSLLLGGLCFVETKFITLFIGYTSHVFLDMFTYTGVKLLYPLNVSFTLFDGFVQTGKSKDKFLAVICGLVSVVLIVRKYLIL